MNKMITFRLELSQDDLAQEEDLATSGEGLTIQSIEAAQTQPGSSLDEAMFVETVAVVAVASIAMIAKRLVENWLRSKEEGVQIDLRQDPPLFSKIANVPRGFVLVIDKDGKATPHQANYEKSEDVIPLLTQLLSGG